MHINLIFHFWLHTVVVREKLKDVLKARTIRLRSETPISSGIKFIICSRNIINMI